LGDHRVSSIFLEPISLGYFGIILVLWGIVRSQIDNRIHLFALVAGLLCIVLSDSRFGASVIVIAIIVALLPSRLSQIGIFALPVIVIYGLLLIPELFNLSAGLGFSGRFSYAARVLADFDAWNWFGFKASRMQTFDSGYAYVFSGIGVIGFATFWVIFLSIRGRNAYFYVFRNSSAAYFAIALCIGAGQFTIKTASLLWFMMGALAIAWIPERQKKNAHFVHPNPASFSLSSAVREWRQPLRVNGA
jgi:putative polymerase